MDCRLCDGINTLCVNNSDGNVVCTECGCISEENIWLDHPTTSFDEPFQFQTPHMPGFEHLMHDELPEMVLAAAYVHFSNIKQQKTYRANMRKTIIANCVYMACNECNVARPVKEIARLCGVRKRDLLKVQAKSCTSTTINANDQIIKYVSHVGLNDNMDIKMNFIKRLRDLVNNEDYLESKAPNTRISTFIFIVAQEMNVKHITKKFIVDQFDLSIVTLNKSLKEFFTNFT